LRFDYLVIAGGRPPSPSYLKKLVKIAKDVVTVDGGGKALLALKIRPLLHVGDDDSLEPSEFKRLKPRAVLKLNTKKNYSDLEFALRQLDPSKSKLVIGGHIDSDDRPDHGFFNLLLLTKMTSVIFADEKNWITNLSPMAPLTFSVPKATLFSIALLKKSKLWIDGSAFDVNGKFLRYQTEGLSNISRSHQVCVETSGTGLVFVSSDITKTKIDGTLLAR